METTGELYYEGRQFPIHVEDEEITFLAEMNYFGGNGDYLDTINYWETDLFDRLDRDYESCDDCFDKILDRLDFDEDRVKPRIADLLEPFKLFDGDYFIGFSLHWDCVDAEYEWDDDAYYDLTYVERLSDKDAKYKILNIYNKDKKLLWTAAKK